MTIIVPMIKLPLSRRIDITGSPLLLRLTLGAK